MKNSRPVIKKKAQFPKYHKPIRPLTEHIFFCPEWNDKKGKICHKKATKFCCGSWRCKKHHTEHLEYGFAHIELEEEPIDEIKLVFSFWGINNNDAPPLKATEYSYRFFINNNVHNTTDSIFTSDSATNSNIGFYISEKKVSFR